jgi:hypothetical protein
MIFPNSSSRCDVTARLLALAAAFLARLGLLRRPLPPAASSAPAPVPEPFLSVFAPPGVSLGLPGRYSKPATGGVP